MEYTHIVTNTISGYKFYCTSDGKSVYTKLIDGPNKGWKNTFSGYSSVEEAYSGKASFIVELIEPEFEGN